MNNITINSTEQLCAGALAMPMTFIPQSGRAFVADHASFKQERPGYVGAANRGRVVFGTASATGTLAWRPPVW